MTESAPNRRLAVLVAPVITFGAVVVLMVVARFYDRSPVQAPPCQFKQLVNLPCLSCGGTRSLQALVNGKVTTAILYNPAVVLGVATAFVWPILGVMRYYREDPVESVEAQNRRIRRTSITIGVLLFLNWIYLIFFFHEN